MSKVFLSLSFCLFVLTNGCVSPVEGCLDPFATNYELTTDRECPDSCCTYPKLNLLTSFVIDSIPIDSSSYYTNNLDSYLKFKSFYLVLSQFDFESDSEIYQVTNEGNLSVLDDLVLIEFNNSSTNPGAIILEDELKQLSFSTGFPNELNTPNSPNREYELIELFHDSMYYDTNEYYELGMSLEIDSISKEILKIEMSNIDLDFDFSIVKDISRGTNLTYQLNIDFLRFFEGLDFQSTNIASNLKESILENISNSIEVN